MKIPCQVMTRTSGYFANVSNMNPGKKEEVSQRKMMNIDEFINAPKKVIDNVGVLP